jgi:hypothetical protein
MPTLGHSTVPDSDRKIITHWPSTDLNQYASDYRRQPAQTQAPSNLSSFDRHIIPKHHLPFAMRKSRSHSVSEKGAHWTNMSAGTPTHSPTSAHPQYGQGLPFGGPARDTMTMGASLDNRRMSADSSLSASSSSFGRREHRSHSLSRERLSVSSIPEEESSALDSSDMGRKPNQRHALVHRHSLSMSSLNVPRDGFLPASTLSQAGFT